MVSWVSQLSPGGPEVKVYTGALLTPHPTPQQTLSCTGAEATIPWRAFQCSSLCALGMPEYWLPGQDSVLQLSV